MKEDDITRELFMNMQYAYNKFHEAVADFVHKAEYPITSLNRDLQGKISSAIINMPGGGRIFFRYDEWKVMLPAKDNPINLDLLELWENKEIEEEIKYHNTQLSQLLIRKQELDKKYGKG